QQAALPGAQLRHVEGDQRAGLERARRVEDRRGVEVDGHARAVAGGAGALAAVERAQARVEGLEAEAAGGTEEPPGAEPLAPAGERDERAAPEAEPALRGLVAPRQLR